MVGITGALLAGAGGGAAVNIIINAIDNTKGAVASVNKNLLTIGAGAVIAGALITGAFFKMAQGASDTEEATQKLNVIFDQIDPTKLASTIDTLTTSYGLSNRSAITFLGNTADILTGLGFEDEVALKLSTSVSTLGVDLASFTNIQGGAARVTDIINKALVGEREGLKALGIVVTEEMVKEELLRQGKQDLTGQALTQAKAEATLALIYGQSENAVGDYARTSESFANQTRLLKERLTDLGDSIGTVLLPLFTTIVTSLVKVVDWFNNLSEGTKKWIVIGTALTAGLLLIGGAALILASLWPVLAAGFTLLTGAIGTATVATLAFVAANIWWIAGVVAAIAIGVLLYKNWDKVKLFGIALWNFMKDMGRWIAFFFIPQIFLLKLGIKALGVMFNWLKDNVLVPVYNFLKDKFAGILEFVIDKVKWLIDNASKIGSIIGKVYGVVAGKRDAALSSSGVLQDFISRPGQAPMSFSPKDTIIGTKKGGSGGVTIIIQDNVINGADPDDIAEALNDKLKDMILV